MNFFAWRFGKHGATACDESLAEHDKKYHPNGFDPEHETCNKRAELAKADKGDVLSPSEGAENGGGEKPLVSAAEDAAYMDAVKRGDMETAAKMVREVAGKTGYTKVGFHGTTFKHGKFTKFNKGSHIGSEVYQALNRIGVETEGPVEEEQMRRIIEDLKQDGKDVLMLLVKMDNPLRISDFGEDWHGRDFVRRLHSERPDLFSDAEWSEMWKDPSLSHKMIEDKGYDGLVYDSSEGILDYSGDTPGRYKEDGTYIPNDAYIPFRRSQIKSADPVTYDDDGNMIPLSRRFDGGDDIRGDMSGK